MADFKLLRRFSFLLPDPALRIDVLCGFGADTSFVFPCPLVTVRLSLEQYEVGRVDSEAIERVLPGFASSEASVISDSDETTWSSGDGMGKEDGSWDGVMDPSQMEFRSVEEPDETTGEERSTIPEAIEAASGAETSMSGTLKPRYRASSESCCARACSASAEERSRTSDRYLSSSRMGSPGVVDSILLCTGGYDA